MHEIFCHECGTLIPESSDPYVSKYGYYICPDCYMDGYFNDCKPLSEWERMEQDEQEIVGTYSCYLCGKTFKGDPNTFVDDNGHTFCPDCFDNMCDRDFQPSHSHSIEHEHSHEHTHKSNTLIKLSA